MSVIGAAVGGLPAAAVQYLFGADWSLRVAAVIFVIAAILAMQIPKTPLRDTDDSPQQRLEREEMHTPSILSGGSSLAVLRASVGFLAFFAAFALKSRPRRARDRAGGDVASATSWACARRRPCCDAPRVKR